MDIVAPLDRVDEAPLLLEAGADELYCGVIDKKWRHGHHYAMSPNRRTTYSSNLRSFEELGEVVRIVHQAGKKVQFCLNGALYSPSVALQLEKALQAGVDRIIVATIPALLHALARGCQDKICLSSGAAVLNSQAVRFYQDLGVGMIILPRDLSLAEIKQLVAANETVRFEVFVLNEGCVNIGGFCSFVHTIKKVRTAILCRLPMAVLMKMAPERGVGGWLVPARLRRALLNILQRQSLQSLVLPCLLNYSATAIPRRHVAGQAAQEPGFEPMYAARERYWNVCGACAMVELCDANVGAYKIVGRGHLPEQKVRDVMFVKSARDSARNPQASSARKRQEIQQQYRRIYGSSCQQHCYYQLIDNDEQGTGRKNSCAAVCSP